MRFIIGFVLLFIGIVFVQSAPLVRQVNNLDSFQGVNEELDDFLAELAMLLTPEELESFQKDLYQLVLTEASGEINAEELQLKFESLLQQYFGSHAQSRSSFQNLGQQSVDIASKVLPSLIKHALGKRQATDGIPSHVLLFEQIQIILIDHLPPMQIMLLGRDVFSLIEPGVDGYLDLHEIYRQLPQILYQYLASKPEVIGQVQPLFQQIIEGMLSASPDLSRNMGKRAATDALTSLNQLSSDNLDAILAAAPQLSALINPLKEALAQLAALLPPARLQSLQEQSLQLILSAAAGHIDVNQLKDRLQILFEQYLNSSGRNQVDIDQLIQQVVATDTDGLPNVIINLLSKRDVNND